MNFAKITLALFLIVGGLFGQGFPANSPFTPTSVTTPYDASGHWIGLGQGVTIPITATDQEYYSSRPLAVQALYSMPQGASRSAAAMALAVQGYVIDAVIDAQAQAPILTMFFREQYGYTWIPSALGSPVYLPPGLSYPGLPTYDPTSPPSGSIQVCVAASCFPSTTPPVPVPTASGTVGPNLGLTSDQLVPPVLPAVGVFGTMSKQQYTEGTKVSAIPPGYSASSTFVYHLLGTELMSNNQRVGVWLGPQ